MVRTTSSLDFTQHPFYITRTMHIPDWGNLFFCAQEPFLKAVSRVLTVIGLLQGGNWWVFLIKKRNCWFVSHYLHNIITRKAPRDHYEGAGHIRKVFVMHKNKVHPAQYQIHKMCTCSLSVVVISISTRIKWRLRGGMVDWDWLHMFVCVREREVIEIDIVCMCVCEREGGGWCTQYYT